MSNAVHRVSLTFFVFYISAGADVRPTVSEYEVGPSVRGSKTHKRQLQRRALIEQSISFQWPTFHNNICNTYWSSFYKVWDVCFCPPAVYMFKSLHPSISVSKKTCCATKNVTLSPRTRCYLIWKCQWWKNQFVSLSLNALKIDLNVNKYHVTK